MIKEEQKTGQKIIKLRNKNPMNQFIDDMLKKQTS